MSKCASLGLLGVVSIAVCGIHQVAYASCIDRMIVRPVGTITNEDLVRLEIEIATTSHPPYHVQPTEVSIAGDRVMVRVYVEGGPADMGDSTTEIIELGVLAPRTYHYAVALNPTSDPPEYTADGTFCVEDTGCVHPACRCPVFTPPYTIISLGTLGSFSGSTSWGQAINDVGQVAGRSHGPNGQHAFLWENGVMTDLGTFHPSDAESSGLGINNLGDVVGYSYGSGAVLWRDGQVIDLGTLGFDGIAYAINDTSQVVGTSRVAQGYHAFLWQVGKLIDLTTTFGAPMSSGEDINASGQIVGGGIILDPDGTITNLGTLGGSYSFALAINDRGQVVGQSQRGDGSDYDSHAFLWDDGVMTDLGALGGFSWSSAVGINNVGQVIGSGSGPPPWCRASFLYGPESGLQRLPDLIPIDSGWTSLPPHPSLRAYGINDRGEIAGTGGFQGATHAFLMTPSNSVGNPIPTLSLRGTVVLTLLILGAGSALLRRRAHYVAVGNPP